MTNAPPISNKKAKKSGAFKLFINTSTSKIALTNHSGFGSVALSLAPHFKQVICLCPNHKEALITQKELAKHSVENITLVVGGLSKLPFIHNSIDSISLHELSPEQSPDLINECSRLTPAQGEVYLNYYHTERNILSRVSHLRKTLNASKQAGFQVNKRLYHYPSLSEVIFIRQVNKLNFKDCFFELKRFFLGDNYALVINKPLSETTCTAEKIKLSAEQLQDTHLTPCNKVLVGSQNSIILDFGKVIARLPQKETAITSCLKNFDNLKRLQEIKTPYETPRALGHNIINGQVFFIESKLQGESLDTVMSKSDFEEFQDIGVRILLNNCLPEGQHKLHEAMTKQSHKDCDNFRQNLSASQSSILDKTIETILFHLADTTIPKLIQHGDFKPSNFLGQTGKTKLITGVIDWDMGEVTGLPLMDILTTTLYDQTISPENFAKTLFLLASTPPPNKAVKQYCQTLKITQPIYSTLCILLGIRYCNLFFSEDKKAQAVWKQKIIEESFMPACQQLIKDLNKKD